jgi:hypothetical protein
MLDTIILPSSYSLPIPSTLEKKLKSFLASQEDLASDVDFVFFSARKTTNTIVVRVFDGLSDQPDKALLRLVQGD